MDTLEQRAYALDTIINCGRKSAAFLVKTGDISKSGYESLVNIATQYKKLIHKIDEALCISSEKRRAELLKELEKTDPMAKELIKLRRIA